MEDMEMVETKQPTLREMSDKLFCELASIKSMIVAMNKKPAKKKAVKKATKKVSKKR